MTFDSFALSGCKLYVYDSDKKKDDAEQTIIMFISDTNISHMQATSKHK